MSPSHMVSPARVFCVVAVMLISSSKYLYNLLPKRQERISLEQVDIEICCTEIGENTFFGYQHRQDCHKSLYGKLCALDQASGRSTAPMKKCTTTRFSSHCECFMRRKRLHYRLKSWMPTGLRYCGDCSMFTRRKKSHNGRCQNPSSNMLSRTNNHLGYHGQGKPKTIHQNFWKHSSRKGAFGHKIWKRWFNNAAMNSFEKRLQCGTRVRGGNERYSLRQLESKLIDTRLVRDSR